MDEEERKRCADIPMVAEREAQCREPWSMDDGVPYCDTCGLYRSTIHQQQNRLRRETAVIRGKRPLPAPPREAES